MAYRYLYIDDENDDTTHSIADGLTINNLLQIDLAEPQQFKEQKDFLTKHLSEYDGIILDFRLDGKKLDIPYNAPALAQELRMMAADGTIASTPIILCSTEEKMRATYRVDKTSHDLFDYKFHKQSSPPWEKFASKLSTLAHGYKVMREFNFDLKRILNRDDLDALDEGIFEKFSCLDSPLVTSEYAHFVIKELFHQPGPLIKDSLLAARLGIDIEKSRDGWPALLESLRPLRYSGIFSDGWSRFWNDRVLTFFKEKTGKRLSSLNADDRVKILIDIFGIKDLISASPLPHNKSTNFWTICEYHKKPLDTLEGFKIHSSIEPKSWQESRYLSLDAILRKKGPAPHSSELNRISLIKESLAKK